MGLSHRRLPRHGVQFHPESFLTDHGAAMIANFLAHRPAEAPREPLARLVGAEAIDRLPSGLRGDILDAAARFAADAGTVLPAQRRRPRQRPLAPAGRLAMAHPCPPVQAVAAR